MKGNRRSYSFLTFALDGGVLGLCCVVVCDLETSRMGAPYMNMTLVTYGLNVSRRKHYSDLNIILLFGVQVPPERVSSHNILLFY